MLDVLVAPRINGHSLASIAARGNGKEKSVDLRAIEDAVRTILRAVGEDPNRPGLLDAPRRVARMYTEMFAGLHTDPSRHLQVTFPEEYNGDAMTGDGWELLFHTTVFDPYDQIALSAFRVSRPLPNPSAKGTLGYAAVGDLSTGAGSAMLDRLSSGRR